MFIDRFLFELSYRNTHTQTHTQTLTSTHSCVFQKRNQRYNYNKADWDTNKLIQNKYLFITENEKIYTQLFKSEKEWAQIYFSISLKQCLIFTFYFEVSTTVIISKINTNNWFEDIN